MRYSGFNRIERLLAAFFAAAAILICCSLIVSCSLKVQPASERQRSYELAGDETLPALDGEHAYLLAEVSAKDPEAKSLAVTAVAWETDEPFKKSSIPAGTAGTVSCTELAIFPAVISLGSLVVVAYLDSDVEGFPITANSIEALDLFEERVARWLNP